MAKQSRTSRPRGEVADFLNELEAPGKRFLKDEEKQQLADEAIPFDVQALDFTTSKQYGDRWEMTVTRTDGEDWPFEDVEDKRVIVTLPSHGARDYIMRKLERALGTGTAVGPLVLTLTDIDNGQTWYALKQGKK